MRRPRTGKILGRLYLVDAPNQNWRFTETPYKPVPLFTCLRVNREANNQSQFENPFLKNLK
jgi:hypothetical protein